MPSCQWITRDTYFTWAAINSKKKELGEENGENETHLKKKTKRMQKIFITRRPPPLLLPFSFVSEWFPVARHSYANRIS
jgi:hypothetical protein